ncbi:PadR family transcriptional regulator [Paenibacillus sp. FA6]|uniref:PadR family transcriptional regulator n=1 Tax=Paenibacillus sp. FA6 TaxID=3413029 RepID=UPI003F660963
MNELISVAENNMHGYAIMEDIKTSYNVSIGPGTLYGAISRMEKMGLIEAVPTNDRTQPYCITELGRDFLKERLHELQTVSTLGFKRLGLA